MPDNPVINDGARNAHLDGPSAPDIHNKLLADAFEKPGELRKGAAQSDERVLTTEQISGKIMAALDKKPPDAVLNALKDPKEFKKMLGITGDQLTALQSGQDASGLEAIQEGVRQGFVDHVGFMNAGKIASDVVQVLKSGESAPILRAMQLMNLQLISDGDLKAAAEAVKSNVGQLIGDGVPINPETQDVIASAVAGNSGERAQTSGEQAERAFVRLENMDATTIADKARDPVRLREELGLQLPADLKEREKLADNLRGRALAVGLGVEAIAGLFGL
jgi:hypothetical protein